MLTQTWTYNHKHLLVTLSLLVALVVQSDILPTYTPQPDVIAYEQPDTSLEAKIEERTLELYAEREMWNMEMVRQEAIRELSDDLLAMSTTSPYIDYAALQEKYGY